MEHGVRGQLRLVEIVNILREASQIDYAEVTAACGPAIRRRLADVVEASPYELTAYPRIAAHEEQVLLVGVAPRHMAVLVG